MLGIRVLWLIGFHIAVIQLGAISTLDLLQQKFLTSMDMGNEPSAGMPSLPEVRWGINATHIELQLSYPSLGWIALGLSPSGGMDQSDILFGYVDDKSKEVVVQDRFLTAEPGNTNVNLSLDGQQDWMRVAGSQNRTHTVIRASRKLRTCDPADRPFKDGPTSVIFSYNMRDPQSKNGPIQMHNQRGSTNINFLLPKTANVLPIEPIVMVLNFTMGNLQVAGAKVTDYYCRKTKLPTFTKKYHGISVYPVIEAKNAELLHHFLVYRCSNLPEEHQNTDTYPCGPGSGDKSMVFCDTLIGAWATGGEKENYAPEAGLPFTPEMSGSFIFIETHYNNPKLREFVDNSGMAFALTDKLRKYDIGVFRTGLLPDYTLMIPPGEDTFTITAQCSNQCTLGVCPYKMARDFQIPADGVSIATAMVHMHTRGRVGVIRHFRGNEELPEILKNMNYDYNFQTPVPLSPPRKLLPGDRIVTECTFSTADDSDFVFGGEGTGEEMCAGLFSYYPDTGLTICASVYKLTGYLNAIGFPANSLIAGEWQIPRKPNQSLLQALDEGGFELTHKLKDPVMSFIKSKYWEKVDVDKLKGFYRSKQYTPMCSSVAHPYTFLDHDDPPFLEPLSSSDFSEYTC